MAYLLDLATNTRLPLASHHTIGRLAASVDTHIDKPYVSKLHAAIEWNGNHWRIKHFGLNATWVNGLSLAQGDSRELSINDLIHIADQKDPGLQICDLSPPCDLLWPLASPCGELAEPIALERYHLLPEQSPQLAIYLDDTAQQWMLELIAENNDAMPLKHGDEIEAGHYRWRFFKMHTDEPTEARTRGDASLIEWELRFQLSLDEETTQLALHRGSKTIEMGVRSHHYLLLQLARHRAQDSANGLDLHSQGWIYTDLLTSELGVDTTHLNIQIYRARKQFADSLPASLDLSRLIERRGGRIRLGCPLFKIYKGDTLMEHASSAVCSSL